MHHTHILHPGYWGGNKRANRELSISWEASRSLGYLHHGLGPSPCPPSTHSLSRFMEISEAGLWSDPSAPVLHSWVCFQFQRPVLRLWWLKSPSDHPQEGQSLLPESSTGIVTNGNYPHRFQQKSGQTPTTLIYDKHNKHSWTPTQFSRSLLGSKLPSPFWGPSPRRKLSTTVCWSILVLGTMKDPDEEWWHEPATWLSLGLHIINLTWLSNG